MNLYVYTNPCGMKFIIPDWLIFALRNIHQDPTESGFILDGKFRGFAEDHSVKFEPCESAGISLSPSGPSPFGERAHILCSVLPDQGILFLDTRGKAHATQGWGDVLPNIQNKNPGVHWTILDLAQALYV